MPPIPKRTMNIIWAELSAHLPDYVTAHPNGGCRRRIPTRILFAHYIDMLTSGKSYKRASSDIASEGSLRWYFPVFAPAIAKAEQAILMAYDRMIGLDLENISVDGCIVKAPWSGAEIGGPSPVDRRKRGMKRSLMVDGNGIPIGMVLAPANRHDSPLLRPTLECLSRFGFDLPERITVHLDAGYDSQGTRELLRELGCNGVISKKGVPLQAGRRWVVERTHAWHNNFTKLARMTERRHDLAMAWVQLANIVIITRKIDRAVWLTHRWEGRPKLRP